MELLEAIPLVFKTIKKHPSHMNYDGVLCSSHKGNYYTFIGGATYKIPYHVYRSLITNARKVSYVSSDSMFVFFNGYENTRTGKTIIESLTKAKINKKEAYYIQAALDGVLEPVHHPEIKCDPYVICYDLLYVKRKLPTKENKKRALQFKAQLKEDFKIHGTATEV